MADSDHALPPAPSSLLPLPPRFSRGGQRSKLARTEAERRRSERGAALLAEELERCKILEDIHHAFRRCLAKRVYLYIICFEDAWQKHSTCLATAARQLKEIRGLSLFAALLPSTRGMIQTRRRNTCLAIANNRYQCFGTTGWKAPGQYLSLVGSALNSAHCT